jgi:hypothetical protein
MATTTFAEGTAEYVAWYRAQHPEPDALVG